MNARRLPRLQADRLGASRDLDEHTEEGNAVQHDRCAPIDCEAEPQADAAR